MTHESLVNDDWHLVVARLGGRQALEDGARESGAFQRARKIRSAEDLLRFTFAYCLTARGLRLTAAWGAAMGLADVSNVALLGRLRNMGHWLTLLVGQVLSAGRPAAAKGRLVRIVDATTVPKAGKRTRGGNEVWRLHSVLELPREQFGYLEWTDERGGERLDRAPVVKREIRIGDRAYAQAGQMATVIARGGDVLVRSGWRSLRWLDETGARLNVIALLKAAEAEGMLDRPVRIHCKSRAPLEMRLIALRKSEEAAEISRQKAMKAARKGGRQISSETLYAAGWIILVTSLDAKEFSSQDIADLYRIRWRIELAFKRLKSLIGLQKPPGKDPRLARPWLLAHLLVVLLIEPDIIGLGDSPR